MRVVVLVESGITCLCWQLQSLEVTGSVKELGFSVWWVERFLKFGAFLGCLARQEMEIKNKKGRIVENP